MLPFARQIPVHLLCLCVSASAVAADAAPHAPVPIPDEVVQTLITNRHANAHASAADAMRHHIKDLNVILEPVASRTAGMGTAEVTSAEATQQMLAESKRNELSVLRASIEGELADTRHRLQALHLTDKVAAHDHLTAEIAKRFNRLDKALSDVSSAKPADKNSAIAHAQHELAALQSNEPAPDIGIQSSPLPTWRQDQPPDHVDIPASNNLPAYLTGAASIGNAVPSNTKD